MSLKNRFERILGGWYVLAEAVMDGSRVAMEGSCPVEWIEVVLQQMEFEWISFRSVFAEGGSGSLHWGTSSYLCTFAAPPFDCQGPNNRVQHESIVYVKPHPGRKTCFGQRLTPLDTRWRPQ